MRKRNEKYFEERKFDELIRFALGPFPVNKFYGTFDRRFTAVCERYWEGVIRVIDFSKHSIWLQIHSINFGMKLNKAVYLESGTFEPPPAVMKKINENVRLRMMDFPPESTPDGRRRVIKRVTGLSQAALQGVDAELLEGFDMIMPSLIVLAWTAFEVLCEELLEKAIDLCPSSLGLLAGRGRKRPLAKRESMNRKGTLAGTSDRSKGPAKRESLSYRNISTIRDAYWIAFNIDHASIDRVLRFNKIDALFALRNIIVHKSGYVDKLFLYRVDGLRMFSHARDGSHLQLNFDLLKNLVRPVLIHGFKLISEVSKWVVEHPHVKAAI